MQGSTGNVTTEVQRRDEGCDLCGEHAVLPLSEQDRRGNPLGTVVCRGCGLVSHQSIPTDAELDQYYAKDYRNDYHGELTPSPRRVLRAWNTGQRILERMRPLMRSGDRVFEVGAGIGCTVKSFDLAGYEASGIEPGEGFSSFSKNELLAKVEEDSLESLTHDPTYDVILLVHVIEHLNSPLRSLSHLRDLLKPGGRLYVECPNAGAPHASPTRLFHYAHIYNFTHQTLRMMGQQAGLRVIEQFSDGDDRALMLVFERDDSADQEIEQGAYASTVERICRFNTLTYHLRPRYVMERIKVVASQASDRIFAKKRLRELIERCDARKVALTHTPAVRKAA